MPSAPNPGMQSQPAALVAEASSLAECLDRLAARKHEGRPVATYRLQFHRGFRFEDARRLVAYLYDLGITHCYASPVLKARAGSAHGYDITDHNAINPEIGSEQDFRELVSELKSRGMGLVLDIVPNHMGVGHGTNPWWQDVLENGESSKFADFFDIDWYPLKAELRGKVLLPILSDQYGEELEQGHIVLHHDRGRFFMKYYDKHLPVDPQTVPLIFEPLGDLRARPGVSNGEGTRDVSELEELLRSYRNLPPHNTTDPELAEQRRQQIPRLDQQLAALVERSALVKALVDEAVKICNGEPGNSRSFDPLHRLLEAQAYRLAHWRVSAEEINYRRFFDINDLVGLRMENPQVFAATHRLIRRLLADGSVTGLRIDHPDGLLNPRQYLTRLQMLYAASQCCGPEPIPPLAENGIETEVQEIFGQHHWMFRRALLYVLVEKILEPGEELPSEWPVDGTSGYEFANLVNGLFVDQRNLRAFSNLYRRFVEEVPDVDTLIYENKKRIMESALASEVTVLTHMADEISSTDRRARDFTRKALAAAIRETIACFPVYRTYIDERGEIAERDRSYIQEAIAWAKRRNPSMPAAVLDFLRDILLLKVGDTNHWTDSYRRRLFFTLKFQQLTGPVMAKGLEDTVCYVYNRLVSVNEVGGSPKQFGVSVDDFHRENLRRLQTWPFSLLTSSTHDSKRSEDVRARLNVLSEMPKQWAQVVMRWRRLNRAKKSVISDGRTVPDHNEEYLLYQTLLGAWPWKMPDQPAREQYIGRMQHYMSKAVHEAKVNVSWINPNPEYVEALETFIARILNAEPQGRPNRFLEDLDKFTPILAFFGAMNSLSQTLLKVTSPGVPDFYQGNEIWDFSLVDPDNRRPVDFELRKRLQAELKAASAGGDLVALCDDLVRNFQDGRIKLWTTMRALCARRERPELFQSGGYLPLYAAGAKPEHVCGFARTHGVETVIVAVPRLVHKLAGGEPRAPVGDIWQNTQLVIAASAVTEYENVFTAERLQPNSSQSLLCRELFAHFPVALLVSR